jgi:cobalt-zinc-cadmium resistance protein CzcA
VPVALTIVFALGVSLLLSLTLVPVLASLLLKEHAHTEPWVMRWATRLYQPLLEAALHHRYAHRRSPSRPWHWCGGLPRHGQGVHADDGRGRYPAATAKAAVHWLQRSLEIDLAVQKAIGAAVPEVRHSIGRVGSDELGLDPMGLNETDLFMQLAPRKDWHAADKDALSAEIRKVMDAFPGLEFGFTQPIEMRISEMLTGSRGDVAVKLFGPDLQTLGDLAQRMAARIEKVPGARDAHPGQRQRGIPAGEGGCAGGGARRTVTQVQDELRAQLEGVPAGLVIEPDRRTPIVVRGDARLRGSAERFKDLQLARGDQGEIPWPRWRASPPPMAPCWCGARTARASR